VNVAPAAVLALAWLLSVALPAAAVAAPSPGAPPNVLNIVRVRLKPGASAPYESLEANVVRTWDRAKVGIFWICLQSPKDAKDILYLNLFESTADMDRATAIYNEAVRHHPELPRLQQRLSELTVSTTSALTSRRDDAERAPTGVDFATMRALRLTLIHVRPGREGEFVEAIRTAAAKDGAWLVYEATESPLFALITLRRTASERLRAPAIPRSLRRFRGAYTKAETKDYAVRPAMSHVPQTFVSANPQLWRLPSSTLH
jgi:hypothetical protein